MPIVKDPSGSPVTSQITKKVFLDAEGLNAPPATANAKDDEFEAGSLDGKWTEANTSNRTLSFESSCLNALMGAVAADNVYQLTQAAPGGNFTIITRIRARNLGATQVNFRTAGIIFKRSANSKFYLIGPGVSSGVKIFVDLWTNHTTFGSNKTSMTLASGQDAIWLWIKCTWNGTNISVAMSFSGLAADYHNLTTTLDPSTDLGGAFDLIGLCFNNNNASNTSLVAVDYFRVT